MSAKKKAAALLFSLCFTACSVRPTLRAMNHPGTRLVGVAVDGNALRDPEYRKQVFWKFNSVTPENAMKFDALQPSRGVFEFGAAEEIVKFAAAAKLELRCHTLIWHRQLPQWLTAQTWSSEESAQILSDHIANVASHFRGSCESWDVVNEAFDAGGNFRNSFWHKQLGDSYLAEAFTEAHQADPEARLFYNDYDLVYPSPKFAAVYGTIRNLLAQGVPIHGIGMQLHIRPEFQPTAEQVQDAVHLFSELGLEVHMSEVDVALALPSDEQKLEWQADRFADLARICLNEPACTNFTIWGLSDSHSWIPAHFPGLGDGTLLDKNLEPKPAYWSVRSITARSPTACAPGFAAPQIPSRGCF